MRKIPALIAASACLLIALTANLVMAQKSEKEYLQEFEAKATKGDYQAQRNLAWLYSTSTDPFISNKLLGCAWYKLILLSGSPKVGDGDIGNVKVYCGKLTPDQQAVTEQQALRLFREIYQK
jgi:hypothetical protein